MSYHWLSIHHVSHGAIWTVGPTWTTGRRKHCSSCSVRLVNERLHNSPPRIDEPVVDLKDCEASVLCELFLLVF